ncbi:MAG TPA: twin-arginine translocase TatA/TatE family subunit [Hyphomicrobiales bacterium]|nr:twin-arginine translocase TatA/TatE family subunit [Hyphomicrobiales bacterium]
MAPSWFQILIVLLLVVMLFGRGKISEVMGDFAKGIKSFKRGMTDESDDDTKETPKAIEERSGETIDAKASSSENVRAS